MMEDSAEEWREGVVSVSMVRCWRGWWLGSVGSGLLREGASGAEGDDGGEDSASRNAVAASLLPVVVFVG